MVSRSFFAIANSQMMIIEALPCPSLTRGGLDSVRFRGSVIILPSLAQRWGIRQ
jgi:hypothetical protein